MQCVHQGAILGYTWFINLCDFCDAVRLTRHRSLPCLEIIKGVIWRGNCMRDCMNVHVGVKHTFPAGGCANAGDAVRLTRYRRLPCLEVMKGVLWPGNCTNVHAGRCGDWACNFYNRFLKAS